MFKLYISEILCNLQKIFIKKEATPIANVDFFTGQKYFHFYSENHLFDFRKVKSLKYKIMLKTIKSILDKEEITDEEFEQLKDFETQITGIRWQLSKELLKEILLAT